MFQENRLVRGLRHEDVASILRIPPVLVYNFEEQHQIPEHLDFAVARMGCLNLRWIAENMGVLPPLNGYDKSRTLT